MMNRSRNLPEPAHKPNRASVLGLVNCPSQRALISSLAGCFNRGDGFAVATLNLDHIVKIRRDADFAAAYRAHSHVVADGNPVVWLSRLAGRGVDLVPGSELIDPLCALAAQHEVPVAFLGATQETLDSAADALEARYPGLTISARIAPPFGFDPVGPGADEACAQLRDSGARMCFLALGAPKQERFAIYAQGKVPGCGFVSIGAGLDFIAGSQTRAPLWVRRLAMEWLWRMLSNPRRLARRYLDCILILPGLTALAVRQRLRN